jgi:hypothetical protein
MYNTLVMYRTETPVGGALAALAVIEEQPLDGDRRGRAYRLRAGSLDPLAGWLDEVRRFWAGHLEQFRAFVEAEHAGEEP